MSVEIDPLELGFRRPFTVEVAQILKIKNTNATPVAFKVKTTAPKQYCVRPNSGRIEPGHDVEVSVLLQAMKAEPPLDAKCRDKFLVQSVAITSDKEFTNVSQIWDTVEKSDIQEKKIRVVWQPASGEDQSSAAVTPARHSLANGVEANPEVPPPAYSSPQDDSTIASPSHTEPEVKRESRREPTQEPETAPSTIPVPSISQVKSTAADTFEDLKDKLAKAEATIASLKDQASSGLKQRKVTSTLEEKAAAPVQALAQATRQGTEGVPIQIVAALCLVSFLLAYFLF
ncbi:vesicle-associated protein 2-2 [Podospora aff. communis PSN243]|uniref:Vesicle-associated protein 2-2 n=1 Tax=Podospora aff. communis PSN243 TaxID=3040156 RepID=A0AAV9GLE5_9PEZI|nr:vesicle-associated protein 2-2 [Podospora aff. communis PSN243]